MAITHLVDANDGRFVYVEARDDYLTADEARVLARKLLELAHQIDHPMLASEWP